MPPKRHEGIHNIWLLLADPGTGVASLDDWLLFCASLPAAYLVQPNDAFDLFKYVCRASPLDDLTGGRGGDKPPESIEPALLPPVLAARDRSKKQTLRLGHAAARVRRPLPLSLPLPLTYRRVISA